MNDESVKHEPLTRWYTIGASFPIVIELIECPGHGYWLVEGPSGVFEVPDRFLYWREQDAWAAYLDWLDGAIGYLASFGITGNFYVMNDLIARRLMAKTHLKED